MIRGASVRFYDVRMPAAELPACVFCGEPIGPGEETAGRAPMAAHATCADAALADDAHWDAVSEAGSSEEEQRGLDRTPGAGCLGVSSGLLVLGVLTLALRVRKMLTRQMRL